MTNIKSILNRLISAEAEHFVKIILAIESGSRAWGFGSSNSDYDVRFIYVNNINWYLDVENNKFSDVIEYPIIDEIDINGWDLRKALQLFLKSNPAIIEWIQSPISYIDDSKFRRALIDLLPQSYSCRKGGMHYIKMAINNYKQYLKEDIVPIKKYFYVLRPLLACGWIVRHKKAPPIEFDVLVSDAGLDLTLLDEIRVLLEKKRSSIEMSLEPAIPIINSFIEEQFISLEHAVKDLPDVKCLSSGFLNELFRNYINSHQ